MPEITKYSTAGMLDSGHNSESYYSTEVEMEITLNSNYYARGILETTKDVNYSIGGMLETTSMECLAS